MPFPPSKAAQQAHVLIASFVALGLVEEIAIPLLLFVARAGNDVHGGSTAAQTIDGGQRAGGKRRRNETGRCASITPNRLVTAVTKVPRCNPSGEVEP